MDLGEADDADAALLAERLAAALPEGVVRLVGSRRLGCARAGADLDLVAALPGRRAELGEVRDRVAAAVPEGTTVRRVVGARVPGLRLSVPGGPDVDLVVVSTGQVPPGEAVDRRAELGEAAAVALSAVSDAAAILAATGGDRARFAALAREVKAWARARGLDSAPFGGLPGLAWAVLAARTAREAGNLRDFFASWAAWDWRKTVALLGDPPASPGPVTILTPSAPVRSCTAQVGAGWRELLTGELYRAWELLEQGADPARLLEPPPLPQRHAAWAVVTVPTTTHPGALGRFRGRVRALLTALEDAGAADAHAWPRPFRTTPHTTHYAIGLGRTPPPPPALAAITTSWSADLPGVTVARTGTAPPLR